MLILSFIVNDFNYILRAENKKGGNLLEGI